MNPKVLIATPCRKGTLPAFIERHKQLVASFTYPNVEDVVFPNEWPPLRGKYEPNAMGRNGLIAAVSPYACDFFLWMDVDVVEAPPDLIERLLALSPDRCTIAAPFVLIESPMEHQFYDYGGFIQNGSQFSQFPPYCQVDEEGIADVESVGTCYLCPAEVYRLGGRYVPQGHEVEHLSLMRFAAAQGYCIKADSKLAVRHACLPNWGLQWH